MQGWRITRGQFSYIRSQLARDAARKKLGERVKEGEEELDEVRRQKDQFQETLKDEKAKHAKIIKRAFNS